MRIDGRGGALHALHHGTWGIWDSASWNPHQLWQAWIISCGLIRLLQGCSLAGQRKPCSAEMAVALPQTNFFHEYSTGENPAN